MSTEKILDISSLLDIENSEGGEEEELYTCFEFLHEELEKRKEDSEPKINKSDIFQIKVKGDRIFQKSKTMPQVAQ